MEPCNKSNASIHTTSRRGFLFSAFSFSILGISSRSQAAFIPAARSVSLYAVNTGERFSGTYFENGEYLPDALATVSRLFRDHRDGAATPVDPKLLDYLVALRQRLGGRQPFELVSGYRSPRSNAIARRADRRVARNSYHMQGKAADVVLPGYSLRDMRRAAASLRLGGVGTYRGERILHIDTGPVRAW
jgi:uncharacterized protein YcbK (DUF882 family)